MSKKLDLVQERASMLARTGSFWYHTLSEQDKGTAYKLTQIGCLQRSAWQLANAGKAVLSGGYFTDYYRVLRFTDKDIQYFGTDAALQKRYRDGNQYLRANNLTLYGFIPDANGYPLGDEQSTIVTPNEEGDKVVLPANYRIEFGLITDPDICVQAIEYKDGSLLLNGIDFQATYGYIAFQNNPITLFPDMKFMARHVTYRDRNLLSYTLRLNNVYGPVDRVMDYYRVHQNIPALRLAAAQACGLAVTRTECTVVDIVPLHDGVSYIMDTGERYDAPYRHFHLKKFAKLPAGYIIGGRELFRLYWYGGKEDVQELEGIDPYRALPVRNLFVPNKTIRIGENGLFRPAYEGTGLTDYYNFLNAMGGAAVPPSESYSTLNGLTLNENATWKVCLIDYRHFPEGKTFTDITIDCDSSTNYLQGADGNGLWLKVSSVDGAGPLNSTATVGGINVTPLAVSANRVRCDGVSTSLTWKFPTGITIPAGKSMRIEFVTGPTLDSEGGARATIYAIRTRVATDTVATDDICRVGYGTWTDNHVAPITLTVNNEEANGMEDFLRRVGPKWMVCAVNKGWMSATMQKDLITFLDREAPLGSVLTLADLDGIIEES